MNRRLFMIGVCIMIMLVATILPQTVLAQQSEIGGGVFNPDLGAKPSPTAQPSPTVEQQLPTAQPSPTVEQQLPTAQPSSTAQIEITIPLSHTNTSGSFVQPAEAASIANPEDNSFIYGYNVTLYGDDTSWQDRERVLHVSTLSGVYWVRQLITWKDLQDETGTIHWGELDAIVEDVHNANMKLLLTVVQSPAWATADGSHGLPSPEHIPTFAGFMGEMAEHYRGKVQAYEVWNEPNLACENGGGCGQPGGTVAEPAYYAEVLHAVYYAVKQHDPDAIVVSGSPASTATNQPNFAINDVVYMREMVNHPKFRADAIGVHPGNHSNPPDTLWPENPGSGPGWRTSREFYFRRIEDIRQVLVESGKDDIPLWVTEFGWATENNTPGFEFGNMISFETQADWIVRAFEKARYDYTPWVQAMFLWNLNFSVASKGAYNDEMEQQASFSVLNGDWTPRPAWYAVRSMPKN